MSDQSKRDDGKAESNADEPTLGRRKFLGVGAVALAGGSLAGGAAAADGLGLAQRNSTNGTNGSNSGGNGRQSTSGNDNEGNEEGSEGGSENEKNEKGEASEKDEKNEQGEDSGADHRNEGDESVSKSQVSLSEQEARNAATKEVSGTVQSVELGSKDGIPSYEVLVKNGKGTKEVAVDANSGKVLHVGSED